MGKTILVTGGAGFLGSHLCRRLLAEGNQVICVDNLSTGTIENIKDCFNQPGFRFIEQSIIKALGIEEGFDELYNLACPASPKAYQEDPIGTTMASVLGAQNTLEIATKNHALIFQASTSEVYGNPYEHPQRESYWGNVNPIGIRSCYDEGKRCAESLCFDYHRQHGTRIRVARIFNTYGPYMGKDDGRVISTFVNQALTNSPITIYGDGSQTRSFCYIDDMIDGILTLTRNEQGFIGPVNLGNPNEITIQALAELIIDIAKSKSKIIYHPLPDDDPIRRNPSIELAKNELHWEPKTSLEDGLIKVVEYYKAIR